MATVIIVAFVVLALMGTVKDALWIVWAFIAYQVITGIIATPPYKPA